MDSPSLKTVVVPLAILAAVLIGYLVGVHTAGETTVTSTAPASTYTLYTTVTRTATQTYTVTSTAVKTLYSTVTVYMPTQGQAATATAAGGAAVSNVTVWDRVLELMARLSPETSVSRYVTVATTAIAPVVLQVGTLESKLAVPAQPPAYGATNVQVAGVDEPDIVKVNGTHIAVARYQRVEVYRAYPPSQLKLIATVNVTGIVAKLAGPEYLALISGNKTTIVGVVGRSVSVAGLYYLKDGRLLVIAREYRWPGPLKPRTWILELTPQLRMARHAVVTGSFVDARLVNNTLILVSEVGGLVRPIVILGSRAIVPAPIIAGGSRTETILTALDTGSWKASSIALVGAPASTVYVTPSGTVYLAVRGTPQLRKALEAAGVEKPLPIVPPWIFYSNTTIARFEVRSGGEGPAIVYTGYATVPGRVWKQWMIDVYNDVLRVVTEDWSGGKLLVSLYTFNATTMEPLGRLVNITVNERVHAVRFLGPRLYLVTYRNIDPLFAIDLSDPKHPKVLGFVKSPGFDEYIHPINETLLLGVGREGPWVRISLYRVAANGSVEILSRVKLEGYTWSPVLSWFWGHRAFMYNPEKVEAYIPVSGWTKEKGPIAGVVVVKVDPKGRLVLRGVLSHRAAERATYIGNVLYTVAPGNPVYRVKAYNLTSLKLLAEAPGPVRVKVADILANPSRYLDTAVELVGTLVEPGKDMGPPPTSKDDLVLDDGTGRIYVSAYTPYIREKPPVGVKVKLVAIVRISYATGEPYLIPYSLEVLKR